MPYRLITLFLLLCPLVAQASVFKCVSADGKITFQQTSCSEGEKENQKRQSKPMGKGDKDKPGGVNSHKKLIERARTTGSSGS